MDDMNDIDATAGRLIAASQVNGTTVYDADGKSIGHIEDVMIDKMSGQTAYAVLSFGGFLGMGDKHHPLPWHTLKYDPALGGYVVNVSREQLQAGPSYEPREPVWDDGTWGKRVQDFYQPAF